MDMTEIKSLLEKQGEAFEAFKASDAERTAELKKLGNTDVVISERLGRIEKSLDDAVEAKAAIEAKLAAEKKEREDLEKRLSRPGAGSAADEKAAKYLDEMNVALKAWNGEKNRRFDGLDASGYADYKAAFGRSLRVDPRMLTADEIKVLSVGSDPDGGYLVTPDVGGRMVTKAYETSPMRQFATVTTISTDALEGMEDTGEAGAGYAGEHSQGTDTTTPQLGKWRIDVHWIDTEPKTTQQLLDDASVDVEAWLSAKVGDKFGRFENNEFVNGAANRIRGFVGGYPVAADDSTGVAWGTIGYVATGVSADFAASAKGDKLYDLIGCVKDAYLAGSRFFTRRSVVTKIRQFKDGQNNYLWQPSFVLGSPETILGYPVSRMDDMPALGANSLSLAFGNMAAAYQIVDRAGIRVIRDNLTSKPYVKFYTTKRTGGGVVNFEALKLLKFGTS